MCIGNRNGGDDAIGPYIADNLESDENIVVIDCGTVPENYTSIVKRYKPKQLIIIDAVEMNLLPGEIRIVPEGKIGRMHISTHGIPISVLMDYLRRHAETMLFIGIQPETMSGDMTIHVKKSGDRLIELIKNKKLKQIETLQ
ncbi:MAG: hydrogenase maturation peptidase HycI [Thermoplasmatales archaeon]|nr:MAG: hydrogenase maturation peptidase HycI [Thermoplasmatales archaeon]